MRKMIWLGFWGNIFAVALNVGALGLNFLLPNPWWLHCLGAANVFCVFLSADSARKMWRLSRDV